MKECVYFQYSLAISGYLSYKSTYIALHLADGAKSVFDCLGTVDAVRGTMYFAQVPRYVIPSMEVLKSLGFWLRLPSEDQDRDA